MWLKFKQQDLDNRMITPTLTLLIKSITTTTSKLRQNKRNISSIAKLNWISATQKFINSITLIQMYINSKVKFSQNTDERGKQNLKEKNYESVILIPVSTGHHLI